MVATLLGVALVGPWLFPLGPETAAWLAPWRKASRFLLVGAVWGCTNPLIAEGSKPHAETASPGGQAGPKSPLRRWAEDLFFTVTHWRFYLPFAINQLGSLLNVWLLGEEDMTLAVMMTNSMTFIFTAVTSRLVGETTKTPLCASPRSAILAGVRLSRPAHPAPAPHPPLRRSCLIESQIR